jgi:endonuclease YncB( thermonuclease family)
VTDATTYQYRVTPGQVHDGDTLWCTIDLGFYITHTTKIRLAGINAPELSTSTGPASRDALAGYISGHLGQWTAVTYKSGEEKYGRWLARLYAPDGSDVCAWMLANGYAVPDPNGIPAL